MPSDHNVITYIRNMTYEQMLRAWTTMPPGHEYFTNPEYWGEFMARRKYLMDTTTPSQRIAAAKKVGDGEYI